ncbi:MAG: transcription-repair coupling factor, partial [Myxococcales bacterium]|nr:transcription-repair coupling factor [Myxococcales bacterium]
TLEEVERFYVHPAREVMLGPEERARARERVRALCDAVELPTVQARSLVEEVESGRSFYGMQGFLPAFYDSLETVLDYLPAQRRVVVLDPTGSARAVQDELAAAEIDRAAKEAERAPIFPLEAHYLDEGGAAAALEASTLVLVHRLAVGGEADPEASPLARFDAVEPEALSHLGGEDQAPLVASLRGQRQTQGTERALLPLAERLGGWLEAGMHVIVTARTHTQADRLREILRDYELPVSKGEGVYDPRLLEARPSGKVEIVVGGLCDGFVLATEGVALVTEEEVFGTRTRRRERRRARAKATEAFLEDLRELQVGDFVVHADHGIGRYLGLERKVLAQSQLERMQGIEPSSIEVLVIEYASADCLYLPITRLGQIQRYASKEGKAPRLDKLGGQSFAKKKDRVRQSVRKLADDLLRLYARRAAVSRPSLPPADRAYAEFEATFPFQETADQARAIDEVMEDLEASRPMDRLVCGDVGFGKTEVALRAAFRVAMEGRQVALLCPTTVLAQQHFLTFSRRFRDYPLRVEVISRFVPRPRQVEILAALKEGKVDVVVATHRLLSKDVHFKRLGLLVVDEEQRFGVAHKERIKKLRAEVDVLTLSATPIPRTLHLAIGGLRELSIIRTPPVDRRAVRTFAMRWDDHLIREAIRREIGRGGQVFFVHNRIEGLYEQAQRLQSLVPEARIGVGHGQMKEGMLEKVMTDFIDGQYDVLCSTAIVESGLDIPRANTMIIDRADIFGLAQLYQLRGRVGRSRERAYCYLVTPPPSRLSDEARSRIEALERFTELGSGFQVASLDMELRGAGDLLGAEQSGSVSLVGLDLFVQMLEQAVAELRGEPIGEEVDPEMSFDLEHYLPDDYVEDVGLRLSLYKRFSAAHDEEEIEELSRELEDRFGEPPPAARAFVRVMALRPALRRLRALGCEATGRRVALHLMQDTPLDPAQVMGLVAEPSSPWKLSPDMKLTCRFDPQEQGDCVDRARWVLCRLDSMLGPSPAEGSTPSTG